MKAVLDANVFISALINLSGAPSLLLDAWRDGRFTAVSSTLLRDEIHDVVGRPETSRYFRATADSIAAVLSNLDQNAVFVQPHPVTAIADDPDDDLVLGTALAGDTDYIVSGDKHLLALGSFRGIPIVTPAQFLQILAAEPEDGDAG